MEVIEEHSSDRHVNETLKSHAVDNEVTTVAVAADLCQTSNGVVEVEKAGQLDDTVANAGKLSAVEGTEILQNAALTVYTPDVISEDKTGKDASLNKDTSADVNNIINVVETTPDSPKDASITKDDVEVVTEVVISDDVDQTVSNNGDENGDEMEVGISEVTVDNIPKFKTEVVIEANDTGSNDADGQNSSQNILSEFGESIELSDVLRSDDVTEISVNNNSSVRQEVFNKEELLDILEGNDVETASVTVTEVTHVFKSPSKDIETKLALQQLSRLKREKNRYRGKLTSKLKKEKRYRSDSKIINNIEDTLESKKSNQDLPVEIEIKGEKVTNSEIECNTEQKTENESKQSKNIVNVLVMDWDDDEQETAESESKESILEESNNLLNKTEALKKSQELIASQDKSSAISLVDSAPSEENLHKEKSGEENQPQRRLGRVIKKKVIFDPDNPDTFTKTKTKNKESVKDPSVKEQPPVKKIKQEQTPPRSKSKSPMSNLQWKKPSSKNSKQNRRLTEVDRLLMDEGAVNMIYQLTPEAPKGKKSRETKAEFIKKIQSSTPDGKEMKFRERKTLKYEDGEAKKILGGKHRVSLNSSIKSPSVSEDFETHSADDSIIYRRHSSSSYSSSCMSPRRLSDVDSGSAQTSTRTSQISSDSRSQNTHSTGTSENASDVFMSNTADSPSTEIINKDDYLSIKEKLNSKLSLALNKRKRENIKNEKSSKQKKLLRNDDKNEGKSSTEELKHVTIKIDNRLVEISIQTMEAQFDAEILKEIAQALNFVNSIKDTSVTLLTDLCTICSNLDFKSLIVEDKFKRGNKAIEFAEAISCLLQAVDRHSKLVCCGVEAECRGVALGAAALCDVVLAAGRARFSLGAPPQPAAAALSARCRLPQPLVNDLILFGRNLSATEALQGGLVSKVLWPERFAEQVYNIAKDIASQESPSLMLKKRLLGLKKTEESEHTFLSCLETEREIFVQYWISVQGQELLKAESK